MNKQNTHSEEIKMPEEQFGSTAGASEETHVSHLGIIIGILIVLLALVLGGLYVWSTLLYIPTAEPVPQIQRPSAEENNEPESTNAEAAVQVSETISTSDELSTIEADIESTNLDDLDTEITAIEAEFDAASQ